jgi:L-2-hydroxycarboxylate dehydrogenase (NAD+)
MLGTNPIAIAFPGKKERPIVIDMATSAVALGKIEMALRKGNPIPAGWGMDNCGSVTTNPEDIVRGGALLPLGSDREHGATRATAWASWSTC